MRVHIMWVIVFAIFVTLLSCGEPKLFPADRISVALAWDNDADLDIELWDTVSAHGGRKLAVCHDLPGGADGVSGVSGERYTFLPPYDSGVFVIAVSFWSPGPSKDTDVRARVWVNPADTGAQVDRRDGHIHEMWCPEQFEATLNDDNRDMWFPIAIDARTGAITLVGEFAYRGL